MKHKEEEQAKEKKELKGKIKEMETRLEELEDQLEGEMKASASKLKIDVEESSRQGVASNFSISNIALTNPSLGDLPIVIYPPGGMRSPKTVTFDSFLANFNNANRPGGGDGVLHLDCLHLRHSWLLHCLCLW